MIATVADLLESFRTKEAEILAKERIAHAPTIGKMYEGLTSKVLEMAVPTNLDLRITSGFIENEQGNRSHQIDCMLVTGTGRNIPYTNDYVYPIENVLAVIEVKKTLQSSELDEAYRNLISVKNQWNPEGFNYELFKGAYKSIVLNRPPAYSDLSKLPVWKQYIFHSLVMESMTPVRIVLGYYGYKNELTLRKAFVDYIDKNRNKISLSPASLPSLVICDKFSLVKLNGLPYCGRVQNEFWTVYASYASNPCILLLELIWTRLTFSHNISSIIFGDDLRVEVLKPLLLAKAIRQGTRIGWSYQYCKWSRTELEKHSATAEWRPVRINQSQYLIMQDLINGSTVHTNDLTKYTRNKSYSKERLCSDLLSTNLVAIENNTLYLLVDDCGIAALPDGSYVAGNDTNGRLSKWLIRYGNKTAK
jgi:hypothetical protein